MTNLSFPCLAANRMLALSTSRMVRPRRSREARRLLPATRLATLASLTCITITIPLMRVLEHSRSECLKRRSLFGNRDRCYEVCIPKSHHDCTLSKPYPAEPETNPRTINQVRLKAKDYYCDPG